MGMQRQNSKPVSRSRCMKQMVDVGEVRSNLCFACLGSLEIVELVLFLILYSYFSYMYSRGCPGIIKNSAWGIWDSCV